MKSEAKDDKLWHRPLHIAKLISSMLRGLAERSSIQNGFHISEIRAAV